jgi:ribosomal protein S6
METAELQDKKAYEVGFLAGEETGVDALKELIARLGGEVTLTGPMERILLAYTIKKQTQAHFGHLHFSLSPDKMPEMKDELRRMPAVLRSLIITPPFARREQRPMPPMGERRPMSAPRMATPIPQVAPVEKAPVGPMSNEALEKRIEEIMNA